ncbi:MAG: undecaprenyl-phosphate alpha-N-acetylglucosaminyl 1-phosphate transferase [Planctomycetaceae bacterium]|nr:undecaprenyl-phosphate alpha-N-acetylglucosaminyl 1-phosphate transferase [Planctomycetaceae bacterium]|tara:strand:- start:4243 stop:5364 length:1122 start_codon:yes stop_codon:yes gene_type:complete
MNASFPYWILPLILVPSLLISWLTLYLVRRHATKWGLLDQPNDRKIHTTPIPLGGGLGIWLGVIITFFIGTILVLLKGSVTQFLPEQLRAYAEGVEGQLGNLWVLLIAGSILMLIGLIDDIRGLSWKLRLTVQIVVAAICVVWQEWYFTAFIPYQIITIAFTVFWIVMLINSFNMLDNMDAAAGGVAVICSVMLVLYVVLPGVTSEGPQLFVAGLLLVFIGSLLGFLWHNKPPARIFMGDAGSYFVGFCIAIATILITYTDGDKPVIHAVIAPLIIMAVPIYDLCTVVAIRISEGRSPFQPDKSHFSHRLVELGLSKSRAVLTMFLVTATTGVSALLLPQVNLGGAVLIVCLTFCVLLLVAILENAARNRINS